MRQSRPANIPPPTAIEIEAGHHLARLTGEVAGACRGCAFREGTEANQYGPTVLTAIECAVSGEPFYCHAGLEEGEEPKRLCAGWLRLQEAKRDARR